MDNPFEFKSYKAYLRKIKQDKASRGLLTRLAKAAGCELSYLSRALSSKVQLTMDHAYLIAEELKLAGLEREYFLTMVEHERAASPAYREHLKRKLKSLQTQNEDLSQKTQLPLVPLDQAQFLYHSSWLYCAVHLLVSIPEFQSVEAIARRLNVKPAQIESVLHQLEQMGFVRRAGAASAKWEYLAGASHTSKNSPLVPLHHANWRNRAILDAQDFTSESLHYSGVLSLSTSVYETLRQKLVDMIEEIEREAGPSPSEDLVNINIDAYRV
jgi:uncharacterized protein (TIGR02147 family)